MLLLQSTVKHTTRIFSFLGAILRDTNLLIQNKKAIRHFSLFIPVVWIIWLFIGCVVYIKENKSKIGEHSSNI